MQNHLNPSDFNQDRFGRTVNYLRLSVTDRCNLRCRYCMPAEGIAACPHTEILRYEDLLEITAAAIELGIEKVRITGGEPLVRKGVVDFIERLCRLPGLNEVTLTSNGILLPGLAERLKLAGVNRLNVSIDSLQPEVYAFITRGGELAQVLEGLAAAEQAGLSLKLNMVVMRGINDHEIADFAGLSLTRPWSVRFIEYMPTIRENAWRQRVMPGAEIVARLQQRYTLRPLETTRLCGPAKPYQISGAAGTVGIITPMSDHFCGSCNRIRVTSTGWAKSCLLAESAVDLKPFLRGHNRDALRRTLTEVIGGKAAQHHFETEQTAFRMSNIGG